MLPNTTFNYVIYYSLHCIDVGIVGKNKLELELELELELQN